MLSPPMPSHRRRWSRCWTVVGPSRVIDVEVLARDDERLGTVLAQLGRVLGIQPPSAFSGITRLPDDVTLDDVRLRHGAVLGVGRPADDAEIRTAPGALELRVVGGADAGRTFALDSGSHVVGRGEDAVVHVDDPNVSRRHVVVHVAGGAVEVSDCGSSNGTRLDDEEVADRSPWRMGVHLHIGATTLQIAGSDNTPAAVVGAAGGRTVLRPSVVMPDARAPVEITFPPAPTPVPPRRLAWIAVALPAVGGLALALALRAPTFLFFALLSPLVAVASWWSDRRSGRRTHRRDIAEFEQRTAEADARVTEAVRAEVRAAHRRFPDLAALATAARRQTSLLWTRGPGDPDQLTVRVGTGSGTTGIVRCASVGSRTVVSADDLPVLVDLRPGGLAVLGPRARALGILRSAVGQLAALHAPDSVELVLVTSAARLHDWRWARWLPHLRREPVLVADDARPGSASAEASAPSLVALLALVERRRAVARSMAGRSWLGPWTVVLVDGPVPGPVGDVLAGAGDVGIAVLSHGVTTAQVRGPATSVLTVAGELGTHARLQGPDTPGRTDVALDELPVDVAAQLARDLAGLMPPAARSALPSEVRFLDVAGPGIDRSADGPTGHWTRERGTLAVALGVGADGVERIDLCRQGPHALIAGTTGAGKSELLQTLVAGLALAHPPDRCSFLLVDYKGGAAFAEAAGLPHTVGLLTDLDDSATTRALRSLTAELTRRETLLAAHGVADITDLPDEVPLARLVIVVDEFATLAEELPAFVPGLVGVAQRGRSLGIHLVLATQRPAGVVSADIRANCTLRICLRTTDEADSRDVLGTPDAAYLPLHLPGRALVRTGTGAPRLLQVARVSQPPPGDDDAPVVAPRPWPLPPTAPIPASRADSDLADLVRDLDSRARALSVTAPHRPWRTPLPTTLSVQEAEALTGAGGRHATQLLLGVLDRPDRQEQHPLVLDLSDGGGWLVVGGPRSGRTTFLRSVLSQAVARQSVDQLHVHVMDGGGGGLASAAASLPSVGTAIAGEDLLRAVRLVRRLGEEVTRRRSIRAPDDPRVLLLVDGVDALCARLDDADPARGSTELFRLVRDGAAVGVTCVLTAERAIPGGRLAGIAQHRLVLPLPDRADYAVAGVPLAAVPSIRSPGRAVVGQEAAECQLVVPPPLSTSGWGSGGRTAPLRIVELDPDPIVEGGLDSDGTSFLRVAVGPGGDEGQVLGIELLRTGGLLVVGPPGSGRTTTLHALMENLAAAGVPVLHLGGFPTGSGRAPGVHRGDVMDTAATTDWLSGRGRAPAVVCVDDLGPAGSAPALAALPPLGAVSGIVLVAAAAPADVSTWFQGPVAALRRSRSGLLLCPGPGDADALGIRLPRTPVPVRPGSGWLVRAGTPDRVQVARHRPRARQGAAQSSSSTGPISCVAYQASS